MIRRAGAARAPVTAVAAVRALAALGLAACPGSTGDTEAPADPIEAIAPTRPADDRVEDKPGFLAALTPRQSADVPAPYTSASALLMVKLGEPVTQGQVLARLDDRQLR
ncbi:MAG TPA: hypothetical protein VK601_06950, partial [Kofleriaceae bacterium]|nr:hypothetical protein [Kofleriaceae bacterium]